MLQSGLLKPFPQLLRHHKPNIVKEAAWTLSNITAGTRDQIQMIIGQGVKPENFRVVLFLLYFALTRTKNFKNEYRSHLPIDTSLLADLIKILEVGDFKAKKEATWAITNLTSGGAAGQVFKLVELGGLKPFCNMLGCNDVKIIQVRYFK